jgi:hypothetical protein
MFVLLTGLPLVALAWLGARVLDQDRALASQRRLERLQNAANDLADALTAATKDTATALPEGVTWLRFDRRGMVERRGVPPLHYPALITPPDAAPVFARIEETELANPASAIAQYTRLAASTDPAVRAGAYVRLARVQMRSNSTREALDTYEALLALGATPVAGAPAELVARRQRAALFERAGDLHAAAAERTASAAALSVGRFVLDRTTFDF